MISIRVPLFVESRILPGGGKVSPYLNVGSMTGKGRELADVLNRRRIDIACVHETRWKGSKAK